MPAIAGRAFGYGAGVQKPPKHEPAGLRRWSMGIGCGDGGTGWALEPARAW